MNILVTGGAGFIGSHTTDRLLELGHKIKILDCLKKPVHLKGFPNYIDKSKVEFIYGDVCDKKVMEYTLQNIDIVFHFAAYQDYLPDFSTYFSINSVSTALIYEIIVEKKLPVKKVIVASSQAVMGEGLYKCEEHGNFIPDIRLEDQLSKGEWEIKCPQCKKSAKYQKSNEKIIKPRNQYAISKYSQEQIAMSFGKRYNIPSVALRYSIVQGPRQSFYNAYSGAMRIFSLYLYFDKQPTIYEDGNQIRDFVNIHDVVDANILVMEKEEANYEVFNVGSGVSISIAEFYKMMLKIYDKNIEPKKNGQYRYGDTRNIFSDIGKLKSLGWKPQRDVKQSIKEYKNYLESQKNIDNILDYAKKQMKSLNVVRKAK